MYGIFTYIYHRNPPNVGEYASPMDPVGMTNPGLLSMGLTFLEKLNTSQSCIEQ